MIKLPTGSARNKIEWLAGKLHDLQAWIDAQFDLLAPKPVNLLQNGLFFADGAVTNTANLPFNRLMAPHTTRGNSPGEAQNSNCQESTFPAPYWNLHHWGAAADGDIQYRIGERNVSLPDGSSPLKQTLTLTGAARMALTTGALVPNHAKFSWSEAKYRLVVRLVLQGKGVLSLGNLGLVDGFSDGIHHIGGNLTNIAFDYAEATTVEFSTTAFNWERQARDMVAVVIDPESEPVTASFFEVALIEDVDNYQEWKAIAHPVPDVGQFIYDINAQFFDVNVETQVMRFDLLPFDSASSYGAMSFACPRGAVNHFRYAMPSLSVAGGGRAAPLAGVRIVGYDGRFLYLDYADAEFASGKTLADVTAGEAMEAGTFKVIYSPEPVMSGHVGNSYLPNATPAIYQPKATLA